MSETLLEFLKSIIEGGFLGQAIIATLVWGAVVALLLQRAQVDDRLYDAAFIILGYCFHVAQAAVLSKSRSNIQRWAKESNGYIPPGE